MFTSFFLMITDLKAMSWAAKHPWRQGGLQSDNSLECAVKMWGSEVLWSCVGTVCAIIFVSPTANSYLGATKTYLNAVVWEWSWLASNKWCVLKKMWRAQGQMKVRRLMTTCLSLSCYVMTIQQVAWDSCPAPSCLSIERETQLQGDKAIYDVLFLFLIGS